MGSLSEAFGSTDRLGSYQPLGAMSAWSPYWPPCQGSPWLTLFPSILDRPVATLFGRAGDERSQVHRQLHFRDRFGGDFQRHALAVLAAQVLLSAATIRSATLIRDEDERDRPLKVDVGDMKLDQFGHPPAPPTIPSLRVSFHPVRRDPEHWLGWTTVSVFSPLRDGDAIVDDVLDAAELAMLDAHRQCANVAAIGSDCRRKGILTYGVTTSGHLDVEWTIEHQPIPQA